MGKKKKNYEKPSKVKRFFDIAMCVMLVIILTFQVLGLIGASTSEVIAIKESKKISLTNDVKDLYTEN